MRTSTRHRAIFALIAFAAASVLLPTEPAAASIHEDAIFFASEGSDQVTVLAGGERTSVTAFPTTKVLAGHFTSDAGAQAFLYNPGSGPDALLDVVGSEEGLETELTSAPVAGRFQPFVADFDRDGRDDIFWYAPGTAKDYVWFFEENGSVTSVPMTVDAVAQPVPVLIQGINDKPERQGILWYGAGSKPDSWWMFHGRSAVTERVSIAGTYRVVAPSFNASGLGTSQQQVLFYDPTGAARNSIWTYSKGTGDHTSRPLPSPARATRRSSRRPGCTAATSSTGTARDPTRRRSGSPTATRSPAARCPPSTAPTRCCATPKGAAAPRS
ncbi:FG-GAP repeat domain-containing protein [Aquihabitans daechungensis]|uniref:FG-GAP repeat domain-containing protein n=1 Tax=Aquihabitans daechungensis TaxID=1052257 RepID=UPI003B9EBD60